MCDIARRMMNVDSETFTSMSEPTITTNNVSTFSMSCTILPTMYQILVVIQ